MDSQIALRLKKVQVPAPYGPDSMDGMGVIHAGIDKTAARDKMTLNPNVFRSRTKETA